MRRAICTVALSATGNLSTSTRHASRTLCPSTTAACAAHCHRCGYLSHQTYRHRRNEDAVSITVTVNYSESSSTDIHSPVNYSTQFLRDSIVPYLLGTSCPHNDTRHDLLAILSWHRLNTSACRSYSAAPIIPYHTERSTYPIRTVTFTATCATVSLNQSVAYTCDRCCIARTYCSCI